MKTECTKMSNASCFPKNSCGRCVPHRRANQRGLQRPRQQLILVSVLKGSGVFMADLMRAITIPCCIDFMSVSSYGSGTTSSGVVKIIKDLDTNVVEGADLCLSKIFLTAEKTLSYLKEMLSARKTGEHSPLHAFR